MKRNGAHCVHQDLFALIMAMALTILPFYSFSLIHSFDLLLARLQMPAKETSIVFHIQCLCAVVRWCWQLVDWEPSYLITHPKISAMPGEIRLQKLNPICLLFQAIFRSFVFFILVFARWLLSAYRLLESPCSARNQISDKKDDLMPIYQSIKLCFKFHFFRKKNE